MRTVLGSLAVRRCPETYDALLKTLKDDSLPDILREQALVSLLHTDTDGGCHVECCVRCQFSTTPLKISRACV